MVNTSDKRQHGIIYNFDFGTFSLPHDESGDGKEMDVPF